MTCIDLSVIFITKNEEFHIGHAIDNVKDIAKEIFVVDSGSTDKTVEIAESKGAKVLFHAFEGFGKQWNWALDNCPIKTAWTMKMDPDERLTCSLKEEILTALKNPGEYEAFRLTPALHFMGVDLHLNMMPVTRIWQTGKSSFSVNGVNEHLIVNGSQKVLKNRYLHLDSCNLHQWVEKQNRYTTAEAERLFKGGRGAAMPRLFGGFLERRMWFKNLFYRLPFRYGLMFVQYYIFKGLWMRGTVGLHYTLLRIWVRRLIEEKLLEMQIQARNEAEAG